MLYPLQTRGQHGRFVFLQQQVFNSPSLRKGGWGPLRITGICRDALALPQLVMALGSVHSPSPDWESTAGPSASPEQEFYHHPSGKSTEWA